jgi:small conductance mechanosensitive channel
MWNWLTTESIWIVILSAIVLILSLILAESIKNRLVKGLEGARRERLFNALTKVFWAIDVISLAIAIGAFVILVISRGGTGGAINTISLEQWFWDHGLAILITVVVGTLLWIVLKRLLPILISRSMPKPKRGEGREGTKKRADTLVAVFMGLCKVLIILLVVFMILAELDVDIGPILAGLGIVGIAVGFGAQYLIRDLIAGVFIFLENQYRVGDVAKVADIFGLVEEVNLRKTVLRDLDGIVHHIPNGEIKVASNATKHFSRVNLDISVSYGTDLDHAFKVINRVGQELANDEDWGKKIKTMPQVLRVNKFGDSGIEIKILGEVKPLEQWAIMGELRYRLKKAFDHEGIEIPWPHVKLYLGDNFKNLNIEKQE